MRAIPRGAFLPESMQRSAYADRPLRLSDYGFNISAPHMYAMCLEALDLRAGHRFLDVGSGTGHFTAIAGYLVGERGVSHGLDVREDIATFARGNLARLCEAKPRLRARLARVHFSARNCFLADPEQRTYDRIHVGACCPNSMLPELLRLLRPDGVLVTPYSDELVKACKDGEGEVSLTSITAVRYGDLIVPSLQEMQAARVQVQRKRSTEVSVPQCSLREDLLCMVNNPRLSDLVLCFPDGREIAAHSFLLQLRSPHFEAMLSAGMRERSSHRVVVTVVSHDIMLLFVTYLYGG
jgi:protein-L-isoaspartate(D-aspartate) O-methyltransferase